CWTARREGTQRSAVQRASDLLFAFSMCTVPPATMGFAGRCFAGVPRERTWMMHRARHYSGVPTLARLVIVSLVTLEIMAVGPGLRHASASTGCDLINNQPSQMAFQLQLISAFDAGDVVSVTATEPHTGTPTSVVLFVDNALAKVVSFPGTATFALLTGGVAVAVKGGVDAGTAMLDFNCIAAPPTATATGTVTATATPTSTATA